MTHAQNNADNQAEIDAAIRLADARIAAVADAQRVAAARVAEAMLEAVAQGRS